MPKSTILIRNGIKTLITEGDEVIDELTGEITRVKSILGDENPGFELESTHLGGLRHGREIGPIEPGKRTSDE